MGRIFIAAGGSEGDSSGAIANLTATRQIILLRDLMTQILRSRSYDSLAVPEDLNIHQAIDWINRRSQPGDVAIELQSASDQGSDGVRISTAKSTAKSAAAFYIAQNEQRRLQAEQLLQAYLRRVPQIASHGTKPDTYTDFGSLAFCREVAIPSLALRVGQLTNLENQWVIPAQPQDVALGIAEGLASWSRALSEQKIETYQPISILLNGGLYDDEGILANGNAYVPFDLVDQMGIDLSQESTVQSPVQRSAQRLGYRNLVYLRAIDLREFNIAVQWEQDTRTLKLRSALMIPASQLDRIMGRGYASEVQMMMFLKAHNPEGLAQFADLPKLYREEGQIEWVNPDIAFAQMCVETQFLQFGGLIRPEQNNFAGLGGIGTGASGQSFLDPRIGVRAHIQHLKAYASTEPLIQASVDPRFHLVRRGISPTIAQLAPRWSVTPGYATKVRAIIRQLYESVGLL
ncbi:MAG: glucosaminidase domain-containing protein [Drouetiella hepatica Uher 2000/2452]|jgi:hypothetical protein|uniref:Glucosaminidase domain-containing protein n=1 Tax=Drouetiella hepatica Uher 2000/2452 TaxID=904376 RepID=A0A951UN47_9CYAN|nr:glucosaminidase domain-containing protein [Drouetiella hepatica Uher 2000/2452]